MMTILGYAAAQRYKGSYAKWVYDMISALSDDEVVSFVRAQRYKGDFERWVYDMIEGLSSDDILGFAAAHRYNGGYAKWVYDMIVVLSGGGGDTSILTVTVSDSDGVISGATVSIGKESETTDSDGKATFELEYGDYEATISASGYVTATEELKFRSNKKSFTVTLEESSGTGTLTVTCVDSEETPIASSYIILSDEEYSDIETFMAAFEADPTIGLGLGLTDNDGVCTICGIDAEHMQPTETPVELEYGSHYIYGFKNQLGYYIGSVTIDGATNTETITLTDPSTNTGTVTITCVDSDQQAVTKCRAYLGTEPILEPPQTADNLVAVGSNMSGNEVTLTTFDPQTFEPTGTDIPYGNYYIYADNDESDPADLLVYTGEVTVDNATIEETFTLTSLV